MFSSRPWVIIGDRSHSDLLDSSSPTRKCAGRAMYFGVDVRDEPLALSRGLQGGSLSGAGSREPLLLPFKMDLNFYLSSWGVCTGYNYFVCLFLYLSESTYVWLAKNPAFSAARAPCLVHAHHAHGGPSKRCAPLGSDLYTFYHSFL